VLAGLCVATTVPVPEEFKSSWQFVHMTNWPETETEPSVLPAVSDRSEIGPTLRCLREDSRTCRLHSRSRDGNIAGDSDSKIRAVPVRIMTVLCTGADQTKRRYARTGEVRRGSRLACLLVSQSLITVRWQVVQALI